MYVYSHDTIVTTVADVTDANDPLCSTAQLIENLVDADALIIYEDDGSQTVIIAPQSIQFQTTIYANDADCADDTDDTNLVPLLVGVELDGLSIILPL